MSYSKAKTPQRRRYRLNKKKFAITVLWFLCTAAIIVVAMMSLANAFDVKTLAIGAGASESTEYVVTEANEIKKKNAGKALNGRKIILDAGHGGFDPGAIGVRGTHEDEINLQVTKLLKTELENYGAQVIMTREDDNAIAETKENDMAKRRLIIEQSGADTVISIHMNSFKKDPKVCGPLVLFMPGSVEGKRFAEAVQKTLNEQLSSNTCARSESLYILQSGNLPCILVECGYLSNEQEERKLNQPDYQKKIAKAICEGAVGYFSD